MSRKFSRMWSVLATVAATAGLLAGFATAAQAAPQPFELENAKAGRCMSVEGGGSTANNTKVIQWTTVATGVEKLWGYYPL